MTSIKRTDGNDEDFIALVRRLDQELSIIDGDQHSYYSQFNRIEGLNNVIVAYLDDKPSGCGAIKPAGDKTMEVKRMFVAKEARNKGMGSLILKGLEQWAAELGCTKCILETGKRQPDAIALYTKNGYSLTANWGQYVNIENSVCFSKELSDKI